MVEKSLVEIIDFFNKFADSNSFEGDYYDFKLKRRPLLVIELVVNGSDIQFAPNNSEVNQLLIEIVDEIVNSATDIPRVSTYLRFIAFKLQVSFVGGNSYIPSAQVLQSLPTLRPTQRRVSATHQDRDGPYTLH